LISAGNCGIGDSSKILSSVIKRLNRKIMRRSYQEIRAFRFHVALKRIKALMGF
jgi:hypothetical protein